MVENIVMGRFKLRKMIGSGSFGEIYAAEDLQTHSIYAIKTEPIKAKCPQLLHEAKLYELFKFSINVPTFHFVGTEGGRNFMVIDMLGKSLEDYFVRCSRRFSQKTVLMLADQMISCIEYLHCKNHIHRDIKPDNFVMGTGKNANKVYIIDFGLSKRYRDPITHQHIPYSDNKSLTGTARYASINALKGVEQSRRDDLEALGYVLLYFLRGSLPWMGLQINGCANRYRKICEMKMKSSIEVLCGKFPHEFVEYFAAVRKLQFSDQPDYAELRSLMRSALTKYGLEYDYKYDWIRTTDKILPPRRKDIIMKREATREVYNFDFNGKIKKVKISSIRKQESEKVQALGDIIEKTDDKAVKIQLTKEKTIRHTPKLLTPSVREQMMLASNKEKACLQIRPVIESKNVKTYKRKWNEVILQSKPFRN